MANEQADPQQTDVADLSYEDARQELIDLVARLEGGQAGLEESMRLWQRGEALAAHCEAWLDKAEGPTQAEWDDINHSRTHDHTEAFYAAHPQARTAFQHCQQTIPVEYAPPVTEVVSY